MDQYVVTICIDLLKDHIASRMICELWRGEEDDCKNLARRLAAPSHDRCHIMSWCLQIGRADAWEDWLGQQQQID